MAESDGVLVIGEALVDVVVRAGTTEEHPGGSPANVALGLGRLGLGPALLTVIGRDPRGEAIREHLRASGVRVLESSFSAEHTASATATIGADGSATYDFDIAWDLAPGLPVGSPRLVHTGSIAAFLAPGAAAVRGYLAEAPIVTFDPNIRPALLGSPEETRTVFASTAALATVVKLSDEDAEWLYPGEGVGAVLQRILDLGPELAVITRGGDGAELATAELRVEVPRVPTKVADTIGAGDTYMTSLIASLLDRGPGALTRGWVQDAGRRAARAAALTVSRRGADLPWAHELD
ncbi:MAG TPA: PfkB family carbohydrate kinase [Naasia sp.]|jgi:fructokinase